MPVDCTAVKALIADSCSAYFLPIIRQFSFQTLNKRQKERSKAFVVVFRVVSDLVVKLMIIIDEIFQLQVENEASEENRSKMNLIYE